MTAAVPSSSSPKGQAPASSTLAGNYVLQKRPKLALEGIVANPLQLSDYSNMGMAMISQTLAFDDRKLNGEPGPTDGRTLETEPRQLDVSRTKFVKQVTGPPLVLPAPAGRAVEHGSKPQAVTTVDELAKKARKRLSEDSGLVGSKDHGDIQKKKRKKVLGTDDNAGHIQKKKKKQNPPVPPQASSPTAMVLKYPRTVTLPSIPGLKAKLAWFGPLVEGGTRVRWTSYTCQVIFQYKPDAQTAAMYVNNNGHLLGRNVRCSLFEVDPVTLEPLPNPGKPRPPASSPRVGPPPRPGKDGAGSGGSLTTPPALPHRQPPAPTAPLKSILKKPGSISAARPPSSLPPQPLLPPPMLLHSSLSSSPPPPLRSSLSSSAPPPPPPLPLHSSLSSPTPTPPPPLHSSLSSPTPTPPPPPPLPLHSSLSYHLLHLHLRRCRCRCRYIPLSHHLFHFHTRRCYIPLSHHLPHLHLRRRRRRHRCYIPPSHHLLRPHLHLRWSSARLRHLHYFLLLW